MNKAKSRLAILIVYIIGAVSCVRVTHMIDHSRFGHCASGGNSSREDKLVKQFTKKLDLDCQHQEKIRSILRNSLHDIQPILLQSHIQAERVLKEGQQRISAILSPGQRQQYKMIIADSKLQRPTNDHRIAFYWSS